MFEPKEIFVPKEIADQVQERLDRTSGSVFHDIWNWLTENATGEIGDVTCVFRTNAPEGYSMPDGHYHDHIGQRYYLPIEDSDDYLCCEYDSIVDLVGSEDLY